MALTAALTCLAFLAIFDLLLFHIVLCWHSRTTYDFIISHRDHGPVTTAEKVMSFLMCQRFWAVPKVHDCSALSRGAPDPVEAAPEAQEEVEWPSDAGAKRLRSPGSTLLAVAEDYASFEIAKERPSQWGMADVAPDMHRYEGEEPEVAPAPDKSAVAAGCWARVGGCRRAKVAPDTGPDLEGLVIAQHTLDTDYWLTPSEERDVHASYWMETGISLQPGDIPLIEVAASIAPETAISLIPQARRADPVAG